MSEPNVDPALSPGDPAEQASVSTAPDASAPGAAVPADSPSPALPEVNELAPVANEAVETPAPASPSPEEPSPPVATAEASKPVRLEPAPARPEVPPVPSFVSELPKRSQRPGALALLKLEKVDDDQSFRLRSGGEIDSLATSIARLGQLFPVDLRLRPPDRFQIVSGFRRVAALRLLKRERVLARVHTDLSDEDALQLALADLLENCGSSREELMALRGRLEQEGRLSVPVADTLDRAIAPPGDTLAPEMVEEAAEEVELDELAQDVIGRLAAVNQDLALVVELWNALDPALRESLLEQLGYPEQIVGYLRAQR